MQKEQLFRISEDCGERDVDLYLLTQLVLSVEKSLVVFDILLPQRLQPLVQLENFLVPS